MPLMSCWWLERDLLLGWRFTAYAVMFSIPMA